MASPDWYRAAAAASTTLAVGADDHEAGVRVAHVVAACAVLLDHDAFVDENKKKKKKKEEAETARAAGGQAATGARLGEAFSAGQQGGSHLQWLQGFQAYVAVVVVAEMEHRSKKHNDDDDDCERYQESIGSLQWHLRRGNNVGCSQ